MGLRPTIRKRPYGGSPALDENSTRLREGAQHRGSSRAAGAATSPASAMRGDAGVVHQDAMRTKKRSSNSVWPASRGCCFCSVPAPVRLRKPPRPWPCRSGQLDRLWQPWLTRGKQNAVCAVMIRMTPGRRLPRERSVPVGPISGRRQHAHHGHSFKRPFADDLLNCILLGLPGDSQSPAPGPHPASMFRRHRGRGHGDPRWPWFAAAPG